MKKPFGRWTMKIAPSITQRTPKAPTRPRKPVISESEPKNSAMITRRTMAAGNPIWLVKNSIVAAKPWPPNQPTSFCAPWGKMTIPRASRTMSIPTSSSVCISFLSIAGPPLRDGPSRIVARLRSDADAGVQGAGAPPVRRGEERIDVELADARMALRELGEPQEDLGQQVQIGSRLAAHAFEQLEAAEAANDVPRLLGVERRDREADVLEHLDVLAAEAEHQQRTEARIGGDAE